MTMSPDELRALAEALDKITPVMGLEELHHMATLDRAADFLRQCAEQRPDGWQLVPVEPTEAMKSAGGHVNSEWLNDDAPLCESRYAMPMDGVWSAMLAAAPAAPQADIGRLRECAQRLVDGARWGLAGALSPSSKAREIPSSAWSDVKSRHLASLRDALAAPQAEPKREPLTKAAQDVLAERRRQIEVEGWTLEHDDEHSLGEIAALAAFYAVPDGVHEWDFSSTGHGNTLAEALLPSGWTAKAGEDRRRDLVKAGALILAEIERLDRMGGSDAE